MAAHYLTSFNIRRFERLLLTETNPARRVLITQLLGEEQTRIETRLASTPGPFGISPPMFAAA